MPLYRYTKKKGLDARLLVKMLSAILIFTGIAMMSWVMYPILSFNITYANKFGELVSPLPEKVTGEDLSGDLVRILGISQTDFTKASVWFPKAPEVPRDVTLSDYSLTIPKLNIIDAYVKINGEDLAKSLIHFTGPQPGEKGNLVIFGHSTIPWLYNPKDYKTIFTKLPDLKINDEILLTSDKITYTYRISEMKIVSPDNLSVLNQAENNTVLTLITCVPPGTYFKRLVVKGILESI